MKLWIAAAPLLALALWAGIALWRGRLSRRSANVAVALVLLLYVLTTAALGVFWVARMDLPVFDWHYLFGYGLLIVLALHVALQVQSLAVYFRRASPAWLLGPDGKQFRRPVRVLSSALLVLVLLGPAFAWLLGRARPAERIRLRGAAASGSASPADPASPEVWLERGGKRIGVPEYLWAESRHTRTGVLRAPSVTPARPPAVRHIEGGKVLALPRPSSGARSAADAGTRIVGTRLDLGAVSDLLHHSYGVTQRASGDLHFRAAASAGALYPTDVFVVARADSALAAGVHYYDPEAHTLVTLGGLDHAERVIQSLPSDSPGRNAPILVVLGATFDRSVFKYDTRAYRYVGLDAGHVALNLLEAGEALGLSCVLEPWFDDRALSSAVGLDADGEGVLLAAGCGGRARGGPRSAPAHRPVQLPDSADELELTRLSHLLTSWQLPRDQAPARDAGVEPTGARLGRHADVLALIRTRRSFRSFRSDAVTRADLDAVLDAARRAGEALGRPTLVDVLVAARAVTGLAPGSHRLRDALEPIASDPNISVRVQQAGLDQEVLGRAAFVVVFSLRHDAGSSDGPRDFRNALLQAGLAGQAVYLESAARGLGACGVGAFFDDELAALFEPGTRPIHLVAVGRR